MAVIISRLSSYCPNFATAPEIVSLPNLLEWFYITFRATRQAPEE
ncbi:hypothetical protein [Corynebacterium deserti]|nr:hypothetical protein [Corynebacterium deserti]